MASAVPFPEIEGLLWHEDNRTQWSGLGHGLQVVVRYDDPKRGEYTVQASDNGRPFRYLDGEERDEVVEDLIAWLAANGREIPEART